MKPRLYISVTLSFLLGVLVLIATCGLAWADDGPVTSPSSIEEADSSSASLTDAEPKPEFTTVKDLEGKPVAVLNGSVLGDAVVEATGVDLEFKYFNQLADSIQALKGGKVSALVSDLPICKLLVAENPGLTILPEEAAKDDYGMIFAKSNPLRDDFSQVIGKLREDGTLKGLEDKWCGANEDAKVLPEQVWDAPNGTLKGATCGTQMPMTYMKNGEPVGYEIELSLLIAKELGYRVEFTEGDFSSVLGAVSSGKADFGVCSISITDERKASFDFSSPSYHGAVALVVRDVNATTDGGDVWANIANSLKRTFIDEDRWQLIVRGLGTTIAISVSAGILGIGLGYLTVLARRSHAALPGVLVDGYQALVSGVPLVVILLVLYYVAFGSFEVSGIIVAIMAFTLSFGSVAGSTMWTAVTSLDSIQEETGMALGFTHDQVFKEIVFPQAATVFMPQLAGQFVGMVKETAIVGYITVLDLTRASDLIRSRTMEAFFPIVSTAIIYFLFCRVLAKVLSVLVRKLDKSQRPRTVKGVELHECDLRQFDTP